MAKKSLFLGAATLALLVLLAFAGCSNPTSEESTVYRDVEGIEVNISELRAILAEARPGTYALVSNNGTTRILGTTGYTFIPPGVTLNLYGNFTITTGTLTVGGNLNINRAATLTAANGSTDLIIGWAATENNAQGTVTVRKDGRLTIDVSGAVEFANKTAAAETTGTAVPLTDVMVINHAITENAGGPSVLHGEAENARLVLETDSILNHSTPLATTADPTYLKNLADAKFVLNLTTAVTAIPGLTIRKGTSVATTAAFAPTNTLTVNGTLTTGSTSTINAGLTKLVVGPEGTITASQTGDTFAAVEEVIVDGTFTSTTATFAAAGKVTVNGILTASAATFAAAEEVVVNGTLTATSATFAGLGELEVNGALTVGNAALFPALTSAKGSGTLTLGTQNFGAKAAKLFGIAEVVSSATTITTPTLTVPEGTTLTLSGAAAPSANVVVEGDLIVSTSLTIAATRSLHITGTVTLTSTGSVILTAAATTTGAKLTGSGPLIAGNTDIVGGPADTAGWQAVYTTGTAGNITIARATASTATITGSANNTFNAIGPGAVITQRAGTGNSLTIAANTSIILSTTSTKTGEIILKNSPSLTYTSAGKIILTDGTSVIQTGNTGTGTGPLAADPIYTTVGAGPAYTGIAVPFLHGGGAATTDAVATSSLAATATVAEGKLVSLKGGTSASYVIGGDITDDISGSSDGKISADTITLPTEPTTP